MIEYINFLLLLTSFSFVYFKYKKYIRYIKMVEKTIDELISVQNIEKPNIATSNDKRQKLLECVLTGNSKLYLGKEYTEDKINNYDDESIDKLFTRFESRLAGQMTKSLGKSIINVYSMGACSFLEMSNQDHLSDDLEHDPFLNSALQRFTCDLYYKFGYFLAPLSVSLITSRHYFKNNLNINGTTRTDSIDNEKPEKS